MSTIWPPTFSLVLDERMTLPRLPSSATTRSSWADGTEMVISPYVVAVTRAESRSSVVPELPPMFSERTKPSTAAVVARTLATAWLMFFTCTASEARRASWSFSAWRAAGLTDPAEVPGLPVAPEPFAPPELNEPEPAAPSED